MKDNDNIKETAEATKPMEGNAKNKKTGSKRGIYTAAVSALVIAIVVFFNLVIGSLPPGTLEFDITGRNLYKVSEQSVNYLKKLDKDVSIVVLAQESTIDERLLKLINNYARLSPRVTLKIVDPVLDPTALTTYNAKENNVVVSCAATSKTKVLNLAGMDGYEEGLILYDPQAYQYYGQLNAVSLDAEGQLTSAINNVTSETVNTVYMLQGHGEPALGEQAASYLSKANYETASLNLLQGGKIPEDCKLILSNNPTQDLADEELNMLKTYLKAGGNVMLLLDNTTLKNFNALLAAYGLQVQNGFVGDNDRIYEAFAQQYGTLCFYPVLSTSSDITASITSDAFIIGARGMLQVTPERRGAVVTPFMTTSENGVLVVDDNNSTPGQYIIGATSVETFTGQADTESRLTAITALALVHDDIATQIGPTNLNIFMNAVNKNFGEDVQPITIPAKNLNITPIIVKQPLLWSVVFIGVIPLAILAGGFVYWTKRRNR